jgi:DNA-binding IscR family transcriptional regulator
MKKSSRVSDVLHVLLHMADQNEPVTSNTLARMIHTNPVVVRRTLSGLREKGFVVSCKGPSGGWRLTCELAQISLLDIYESVGKPTLFAMGARNEASGCLVEKAVNEALAESFKEAEALLFERFGEITLHTLYARFSKDMATIRASSQAVERPA